MYLIKHFFFFIFFAIVVGNAIYYEDSKKKVEELSESEKEELELSYEKMLFFQRDLVNFVNSEKEFSEYIQKDPNFAQNFFPEFPLTKAEIKRAELAKKEAEKLFALPQNRESMRCERQTPLNVFFALYTIGFDGRIIEGSRGFNEEQKAQFTRFLCKMLFVVRDIYHEPFDRFEITLVRDLRYSGSNIFIPSLMEIHMDGSSWNPRLLTHEFVHVFRGNRLLTSDRSWSYDPSLSGFEEGFGEGVAYLAMNEYARRFPNDPDIPRDTFWMSLMEWEYDFSNDHSMETTDFWSDSGGTLKYYQRYLIAAAAIMRLEVAIPGFSRRFNEAYYNEISQNPQFRPSRDEVIRIIEMFTSEIDGLSVRRWVDKQRIFISRFNAGKTDWIQHLNIFSYRLLGDVPLFFVETFPNGNNWAYWTNCGNGTFSYLFHRLASTRGNLELRNSQDSFLSNYAILMKNTTSNYTVRGCNTIPGYFNFDLPWLRHRRDEPIPHFARDLIGGPLLIDLEALQLPYGLYKVKTNWFNPHFHQNSSAYNISYDRIQRKVSNDYPVLTGLFQGDYFQYDIYGGIAGALNGSLKIVHSNSSEILDNLPVVRGAFYARVPRTWKMPYSETDRHLVTVPGILTFNFTPRGLTESYIEKRTIVFGNHNGKHMFLLRQPICSDFIGSGVYDMCINYEVTLGNYRLKVFEIDGNQVTIILPQDYTSVTFQRGVPNIFRHRGLDVARITYLESLPENRVRIRFEYLFPPTPTTTSTTTTTLECMDGQGYGLQLFCQPAGSYYSTNRRRIDNYIFFTDSITERNISLSVFNSTSGFWIATMRINLGQEDIFPSQNPISRIRYERFVRPGRALVNFQQVATTTSTTMPDCYYFYGFGTFQVCVGGIIELAEFKEYYRLISLDWVELEPEPLAYVTIYGEKVPERYLFLGKTEYFADGIYALTLLTLKSAETGSKIRAVLNVECLKCNTELNKERISGFFAKESLGKISILVAIVIILTIAFVYYFLSKRFKKKQMK